MPFTPTFTNFASERAKESGPTEKFLEKHKFCPKQPFRWCNRGAKRKTLQALKINYLQGFVVPGAGIEPARIAPLVFETSASTDSAIRAGCIWEAEPRGDAEGDRPSG